MAAAAASSPSPRWPTPRTPTASGPCARRWCARAGPVRCARRPARALPCCLSGGNGRGSCVGLPDRTGAACAGRGVPAGDGAHVWRARAAAAREHTHLAAQPPFPLAAHAEPGGAPRCSPGGARAAFRPLCCLAGRRGCGTHLSLFNQAKVGLRNLGRFTGRNLVGVRAAALPVALHAWRQRGGGGRRAAGARPPRAWGARAQVSAFGGEGESDHLDVWEVSWDKGSGAQWLRDKKVRGPRTARPMLAGWCRRRGGARGRPPRAAPFARQETAALPALGGACSSAACCSMSPGTGGALWPPAPASCVIHAVLRNGRLLGKHAHRDACTARHRVHPTPYASTRTQRAHGPASEQTGAVTYTAYPIMYPILRPGQAQACGDGRVPGLQRAQVWSAHLWPAGGLRAQEGRLVGRHGGRLLHRAARGCLIRPQGGAERRSVAAHASPCLYAGGSTWRSVHCISQTGLTLPYSQVVCG